MQDLVNENMSEVFAMSDKYDIATLKAYCECKMAQGMTSENVIKILCLSDLHRFE